jgi:type VI secretion system secreted protein VgrG
MFQIPSTFITTVSRKVILSGGATACHVFWQVGSSATLGTDSIIKGTILAYTSITFDAGATLEGRALAQNGAVSLVNNTITAIPTAAPEPPIIGDIYRTPDGSITLVITNTPCLTLTLQISADLTNWTRFTTLIPGASPYVFTDTTASGESQRFYRALYEL